MNSIIETNHLKEEDEWMQLWKLKIPPKIKHFLWRILRGCLPLRTQLQSKGVHCPHECPFCETNFGNDWHLFFGCVHAVTIWKKAGSWNIIQHQFHAVEGIKALLFHLLSSLETTWSNRKQQPIIQLQYSRVWEWDKSLICLWVLDEKGIEDNFLHF